MGMLWCLSKVGFIFISYWLTGNLNKEMAPFSLILLFFHSTIGTNSTTTLLLMKYSQHNKTSKSRKCFPGRPNKGASTWGGESSPQISHRTN